MQPPKNGSLSQGLLAYKTVFSLSISEWSLIECVCKKELKESPNGELANCLVVDVETCVSLKAGPN